MKVYLHSEASWQTSKPGERPACLFLSPMLRRRCSMVTRMALEAAYQALERAAVPPQEVNVLHLSRLGEITSLMDLLQALVKREPLSPATFSNSVHHTPIGYFSIQAGNQKIGRTLSAGPMTWVMGCVDAFGLLLAHTEPLLLVYSDESLPPEFSCSGTENLPVGAWAFVFSRQAVGALASIELDERQAAPCRAVQASDVVDWLRNSADQNFSYGVGSGTIRWTR